VSSSLLVSPFPCVLQIVKCRTSMLPFPFWVPMTPDRTPPHLLSIRFPSAKVKLYLCFNWAPRHEGVMEWMYSPTHSLTATLDGGEWSASRPGRFTPRERAPGIHWIGGWVGPRAVLDAVVKREIRSPRRESNPRIPIFQPVAQRYTDWAITVLFPFCNQAESAAFLNLIVWRARPNLMKWNL
jgi:hypothetical protein